jgi:hypothetical protein
MPIEISQKAECSSFFYCLAYVMPKSVKFGPMWESKDLTFKKPFFICQPNAKVLQEVLIGIVTV